MTASKKLGESSQGTLGEAAEPSLDQRLGRLEAIVAELEGGGVPLEQAIERYQEGVLLLKECRAVLSVYRRRVEELSQNAEESVRAYSGDPDVVDVGESRAASSSNSPASSKPASSTRDRA